MIGPGFILRDYGKAKAEDRMEDVKYVLFTQNARVPSKYKFDMALSRKKVG